MSDRESFLRAIADQPADRTARLVFADFLEETGGASGAVRAEFVRAQVEADTVHPNSNRHAELEARARELFADHWLDWWVEVCSTVGLPAPHRPTGVRGWLTRKLVGGGPRAGTPYTRRWPTTVGVRARQHEHPLLDPLGHIEFRGGFPEALSFLGTPGFAAEFLRKWADVSPLAALDLHGIVGRDWRAIDGPHLAGLHTLSLGQSNSAGLEAVAASPHLVQLKELHLIPDRSNILWAGEQYRAFAGSPLAGRITRLNVVFADVTESLALHSAPLGKITALGIHAPRSLSEQEEFARAAAAAADLLSLPHLDHLEELALDGVTAQALNDVDRSVLGRLRKLVFEGDSSARYGLQFSAWVLAPNVTDLSLAVADWSFHSFALLTRSPVMSQLQHLRLDGTLTPNQDAVVTMMHLTKALDTDRLETLRVGEAVCPAPAVRAALTEKFGARVRFG